WRKVPGPCRAGRSSAFPRLLPAAPGARSRDAGKVTSAPVPHPAHLRAVDVKILQQLAVVNEGIEAVKWLLEEKSTLTSRCSSLTSSQYSLVGSQEASRRGSWDSLQDPNDRLDSISLGSYLDTLADDMDEYSQNAAEPAAAPGRALARAEHDWARIDHDRAAWVQSGAASRLKTTQCRGLLCFLGFQAPWQSPVSSSSFLLLLLPGSTTTQPQAPGRWGSEQPTTR
uniref:Leucine rich adaptor protein 1 n=1 Tax=Nothoprocta perdicaria TaxID=30464 RepID=A0A8C6ZY81_NOTPE